VKGDLKYKDLELHLVKRKESGWVVVSVE